MAHGDKSNGIEINFELGRCLHARSVWAQCSLCIDSCPSDCLHTEEGSVLPVLDPEKCMSCGQCLSACPLDAFSSPHFSERQLLNRIGSEGNLYLRCFLPYGESGASTTAPGTLPYEEYHLGACLAALTPGALFELAFSRPCTLQNGRCENCQLFTAVKPTLQCNEEMAFALLADWGRENHLREQVPLFLPAIPEGKARANLLPVSLDDSFVGTHEASEVLPSEIGVQADAQTDLTDNIKSSIRALFHGHRSQRTHSGRDNRIALGNAKLQVKRRHIPLWRARLNEFWQARTPTVEQRYPWPKQIIDADICRACGTCMQLCPTGSIHQELKNEMFTYYHNPGTCTNCGLCITSCSVQAISRGYQNTLQPFDKQICLQWPAKACVRCGLPVRAETGDVCALCAARPDTKVVVQRINKQMTAWIRGEKPAARLAVSDPADAHAYSPNSPDTLGSHYTAGNTYPEESSNTSVCSTNPTDS